MLQIDWTKWVNYMLPGPLRKSRMIAWLYALIFPIRLLYSDLLFFKQKVDFDMAMTGQVVILQRGLNDLFDIAVRRIRIVDAEQPEAGEGVFAYLESENNPLYLPKNLTSTFSVGSESSVDFLICLPGTFYPERAQIAAMINKYKLASKKWNFHWTSSIVFNPNAGQIATGNTNTPLTG